MLQYPTISMYRGSYVPYVWRHCGLLRPCRCTGRQLTALTEEGEEGEEEELMLCPPNSNLSIIYICYTHYIMYMRDTLACALMILFYVIMYVHTYKTLMSLTYVYSCMVLELCMCRCVHCAICIFGNMNVF